MQQQNREENDNTNFTFSILNRIGGDATMTRVARITHSPLTFSILNRIGGDATSSFLQHLVST